MANIKELKIRIKSTKNTLKITKAMKLVSAAKLARAQAKIVALKPYSTELENTLRTIASLTRSYDHPYFKNSNDQERAAVLVVSADKGLCGGYNSSVVKRVKKFLEEKKSASTKFYFIGRKAKEFLKNDVNTAKQFTFSKVDPSIEEIRSISQELADLFLSGEFNKVYVIYNTFYSAISFESKVKQVLPLTHSVEEDNKLKENFPFDFKYDVDSESLLETLVPETYVTTVHTAILDAIAAEHGSRMNAMENASKNSKEVIRKLTLKMNKMRQARITTELIEVVSGAESLNG